MAVKLTPAQARATLAALGIRLETPGSPPLPPGVKRKNKYHAKPTAYNGVRYDSKFEAARAAYLDRAQEDGIIFWWIGKPKFRLGCPENVYIADFLAVSPAGVRVEDTKGVDTPKFKHDVKLWRAYGPCPLWIVRRGGVEIVQRGIPPGRGPPRRTTRA